MNILLWVLQILLALHTAMGAVWKFSHNPEQTMPSLKAIPRGAWLVMSAVELFCAAALVLPAFHTPLALGAPAAATAIAGEMLLFCGLHLRSGDRNKGPMVYWLVVAALCALIAYGRWVLIPLELGN